MGTLLIVVGAIWAIIGVANLIGMFGGGSAQNSNLMSFGLIFNMVLFIIPGLILAGIGSRVSRKSGSTTSPELSIGERLKNLDSMLNEGTITQAEYDEKRAKILQSI